MAYVSDLAALAAFGTAAWQVVGTWYRFKGGRNKKAVQQGPFDAVAKALRDVTAKGSRTSPEWGSGPVESGHAHVVAGWSTLPPEARAALIEDLMQLAILTGQLQDIKAIRDGRTKWSQLSPREQGQVVAALDGLKLDTLGPALRQAAPQLAKSWLWQVTETVPMLSQELSLSDPCGAELAKLTKTFDKADAAVKEALSAERQSLVKELAGTIGPLDTAPALGKLQELKSLLAGDLAAELGTAGTARATAELRSALAALASEQEGGLLPEPGSDRTAVQEAAKKLTAQVDQQLSDIKAAREAEAEAAGKVAEVSTLTQVATSAPYWQPTAPLLVQVALVEVVLQTLAGLDSTAAGNNNIAGPLVKAARLLVPKLPITGPSEEGSDEEGRITQLLAALEPAAANGSPAEEDSAPAPTTPQQAASELAGLIVSALEEKLPAAAESAAGDEGIVQKLVADVVSNVVIANTSGGALAAAVTGAAAVRRSDVISSVLAGAARMGSVRETMLTKLDSELPKLRAGIMNNVLTAKLNEAADLAPAQRLALAASYIREMILPGPDSGLGKDVSRVLDLVRPDEEGALLSSGAAAAVVYARNLLTQVTLSKDLSTGLQLGPGLVSLLERLQEYASAPVPEAAESKPEANGEHEQAENGGEQNGHAAPVDTSAARNKAVQAAEGLLENGMVLLELSAQETRKLDMLKTASQGCSNNVVDAVMFNRHLTTLKDLSGQLNPILTAMEAKLGATQDAKRKAALASLRDTAVAAYKTMSKLIRLETQTRSSILDTMQEIRDIVYGMKLQQNSAALESGLAKLEGVRAKAEGVMSHVAGLPESEDVVSEVMVMEEQIDRTSTAVRGWADWVRVREFGLGITPASATVAEEGSEIGLIELAELQAAHGESSDVSFIDLYGAFEEDEETAQEPTEEEMLAKHAALLQKAQEQLERRQIQGFRHIARGQVAVVLTLTGNAEGSELLVTKDVGLPSTKSPLQLFAERLLKVQLLAAAHILGAGAGIFRPIDLFLVCPKQFITTLKKFLSDNAYFGLQPSQVHVVEWDVRRPVLSADMKVVMEGPGRMSHAAPCSGDVWLALKQAGALSWIQNKGVKFVEVHTVDDNLMLRVADPVFIGCCADEDVDAAAKVTEPANMLSAFEGYASFIATKKAADAFGKLVPALGSYCFSAAFIKQIDAELQSNPLSLYRLAPAAPKTAAYGGKAPPASSTAAYQLDRHLSDWVVGTEFNGMHCAVMQVDINDEFAPVVGNPPLYVPASQSAAVDSLLLLHTDWVLSSGGEVEDKEEGVVEVSPLTSYAGEGLEEICAGKTYTEAYELDLQGFAAPTSRKISVPTALLSVPLIAAWLGLATVKVLAKKQ